MKNCPTCGQTKRQNFANKGAVTKDDDDGSSDDTSADDAAAEEAAADAPAQTAPADTPPPDAAPAPPPDQAQPDSAAQPAPAAAGVTDPTAPPPGPPPVAPLIDSNGNPIPPPPPDSQTADPNSLIHVEGQNKAFKSDISQGLIQPKTMQSLFANKDTLPKLGTLFGLLVAGAGSGLAHQSNSVMDMMQKELDRDLQAQQTSAANKQNWYSLGMQHAAQNATLPGIAATSSMNQMRTSMAYGMFTDYVNSMPPGSPARAQAEQTLQGLQNHVDQLNATDSAKAVGKSKLLEALQGIGKKAPAQDDGSPISMDRLNSLQQAGNSQFGLGPIPGKTMSEAEASQVMNHEMPLLTQNRQMIPAAMESFDRLNKMTAAGQGKEMAADVARAGESLIPMAGEAAQKATGIIADKYQTARNAEIQKLVGMGLDPKTANALMPSGYDVGDTANTRNVKRSNLLEILQNREKVIAPVSARYGLITEFPGTNTQKQKRRAP